MEHFRAAQMLSGMVGASHPHKLKDNRLKLQTPLERGSPKLLDLLEKAEGVAKEVSGQGRKVSVKQGFRYSAVTGVFFQRAPPGRPKR
jgi:hypothetical protein